MMRAVLFVLPLAALTACVTPTSGPTAGPALVAALDTQSDGFVGTTSRGERFQITSTSVSSTRLCRVVTIESASAFAVESFCKAPGGQWR